MPPSSSSVAARRCTLLLVAALIVGITEAWWGASALFAAGADADHHAPAGGIDLIRLTAVVVGGSCVVVVSLALTWQLGRFVNRRRSGAER